MKIEYGLNLNPMSLYNTMASYASIASKPSTVTAPQPEISKKDLKQEVQDWMTLLSTVKTAPDTLLRCMELLRREMESAPVAFRGVGGGSSGAPASSTRSFGNAPSNSWRSGNRVFNTGSGGGAFESRSSGSGGMHRNTSAGSFQSAGSSSPSVATPRPVGRYQSKFKATGNIEEKILNTVIGNKLNAFTPLTYDDTRDFIYQIMDSGETEFVRDFIEKVFTKATLEDLYCGLFAKLIAEIAHRYPVMYEEMNKYHQEFMKVFETIQEESEVEYATLVKQKQYRMGYGQFIAELAGQNALEKQQLMSMVRLVMENIWIYSSQESKTKAVEELIDCFVRLSTSLKERCPSFFHSVKGEVWTLVGERVQSMITKQGPPRPSLSSKARFGLMDLKDLLV
jgi:hypothetical protein